MKKVIVVMAVLAMAATANANLLSGTWGDSNVDQGNGWGSGITWSGASSTGITGATNGGSYYAYQVIPAVVGETYTVTGNVSVGGSSLWTEVLLFSLDGGENLDAEADSGGDAVVHPNIISKIDSWGMNTASIGAGPVDIASVLWAGSAHAPARINTDHVATSDTLVIALKVGASGGSNTTTFSEMSLTPEPTALALMVLGFLPLLRRRR